MSMKLYEVLGVPEGSVIETRTVGSSESGLKYHAGVTCAYDPLSEKDTIALLLGYLEYRLAQDSLSKETRQSFDAIKRLWPKATHVERNQTPLDPRLFVLENDSVIDTIRYGSNDIKVEMYRKYPLSPPENPWRRVVNIATAKVINHDQ